MGPTARLVGVGGMKAEATDKEISTKVDDLIIMVDLRRDGPCRDWKVSSPVSVVARIGERHEQHGKNLSLFSEGCDY